MKVLVKTAINFLSLIFISTTLAEGAEVSAFNGPVSVFSITSPGWQPLAEGTRLEAGDNIRTEAGASVELILRSGHVVLMEEKTTAAILSTAFAVFQGNVKIDCKSTPITEPLTIKTPHLTCSTDNDVLNVSSNGNSTKVNVIDGLVALVDIGADTRKELRIGQSYRSAAIEYINDGDLVIEPVIKYNFTDATCWPPRDGACSTTPLLDGNEPSIKLSLGGNGVQFNSRWIHNDKIDLEKAPYLDMCLRTETTAPVSILFLVGDDTQNFYQLPLVGIHANYKIMDPTVSADKEVADGKWHRLTWNLRDMIRKNLGRDVSTIHSVIIGKWTAPDSTAEMEIKALTFGALKSGTSE